MWLIITIIQRWSVWTIAVILGKLVWHGSLNCCFGKAVQEGWHGRLIECTGQSWVVLLHRGVTRFDSKTYGGVLREITAQRERCQKIWQQKVGNHPPIMVGRWYRVYTILARFEFQTIILLRPPKLFRTKLYQNQRHLGDAIAQPIPNIFECYKQCYKECYNQYMNFSHCGWLIVFSFLV